MKTVFLLLAGVTLSLSAISQKIIKIVQPAEPVKDSIVYQGENAILTFDRQELMNFMISMDTTLRNNKNSSRVFRNIQFTKFSTTDMAKHFRQAYCYLEDTLNQDLAYRTDKMYYIWVEDGSMLLPYVEEILPELLSAGTLKIVEKGTRIVQPEYRIIYEPVNGTNYRVFRLKNGKEVFRESTFCAEQQLTHR